MISIRLPKIKSSKKVMICAFAAVLIIGILLVLYNNADVIKKYFLKCDPISTTMETEPFEQGAEPSDAELIATSQFLNQAPDEVTQEEEQVEENAEEPDIDALYPVEITDIYAQTGEEVEFVSFHPDAVDYTWEVYDMAQKDWIKADSERVFLEKDELHREVSIFRMQADVTQDGSMIRCTVNLKDGSSQKDTASLSVLQSRIIDISINDSEISKCGYISALEVPVKVTYENDQSEVITGLYGLKFLCSQKTTEYEESVSGNLIEKRIETITECDYTFLQSGINERTLRYVDLRENEQSVQITGCDKEPPVIEEVIVGDYIVSKENKTVPVKVEIYAEDNDTPYPRLKYAFAHEDVNTTDIIFSPENEWNVDIDKNGVWIAYVLDESGNIAEVHKEIIVVDELPPNITVSLKEMSWCRENVIMVTGKDGTDLSYQLLKGSQCIKDWTQENSFQVTENGTYTVKAKDVAGNETTQEIVVNNIDIQAPVINNIKEGGNSNNEK